MNSPIFFCKKTAEKQNASFIDQAMDKLYPKSPTNNYQCHLSLFCYHKTITEIKWMYLILLRKLTNLINSFPGQKTSEWQQRKISPPAYTYTTSSISSSIYLPVGTPMTSLIDRDEHEKYYCDKFFF